MADNKKSAQRKACLDMVIQLYKAGLIPGNKGDRFGQGFNGPKVIYRKCFQQILFIFLAWSG